MKRWIGNNVLWLAALGLMLASSGIDGTYMVSMMQRPLWWLGYVMNTMSDLGGLAIMYAFGRLQQEPKRSKKWKLSWMLLGAEVVAIGYSWFFSWRQLLRALLPTEQGDTVWVAPIAAGFIPLLLAFIGWAQALQAGKLEEELATSQPKPATSQPKQFPCQHCSYVAKSQAGLNAHQRKHREESNA